jgi:hypothetical protein
MLLGFISGLSLFFYLLGFGSLLWAIPGIPVAIVMAIKKSKQKNLAQKRKYTERIILSLAGIPILILCIILYFILNILYGVQ